MSDSKVVAIIQARMASSRLPGKVLKDIAGEPMLAHVVRRTRLARMVDQVVVATTTDAGDDLIVASCRGNGIAVTRGHPTDVLDRYYQAAREFGADIIVRVTADCPLMDPDVIDRCVQAFRESQPGLTLVVSRLPHERTYPIGLDVEVCSLTSLEIAWRRAKEAHQREHVMPYFYENPEKFQVEILHADQDFGQMRWTVDTVEDLEFVRAVYSRFSPRLDFDWREVLELVRSIPEIADLNAGVEHRTHKDVG